MKRMSRFAQQFDCDFFAIIFADFLTDECVRTCKAGCRGGSPCKKGKTMSSFGGARRPLCRRRIS